MTEFTSQRTAALMGATQSVFSMIGDPSSFYNRYVGQPGVSDFAFGNPHDMPLTGFTDTLQRWSVPQNPEWFAYKMNEPKAQAAVVEALEARRGLHFEPQDICMTTGGFTALSVTINTVVSPGDEVIFMTPPWFFYEAMILNAGGSVVRVPVLPDNFDLDLDAIQAAITPRTRAIIVNSPCNPTGKIYPAETLTRLGALLTEASQRNGRIIYLLSDEAYSRIIFDGADCPSPTSYYPHSFLLYTYGKTLLTPGQRIGFIALPPAMPAPEREMMRTALLINQIAVGWAFPNALLQHGLRDLEKLSIDIEHLQEKRDRMVQGLRDIGYQVHMPESTFYLLPQSPIVDDWAFCEQLAEQRVLCLPGKVV
ncbi:MAG TPA: aminotransferase class I/II-fold pyridoxal phosphate-dependent enzyme, partial [Phototrophicaceae bacterium]|nr:aminotransferase class I/II-fold pyridoxal phosphate-dependent enzyme [Phototrophicaceae bacterium]